MSEAFEVGVTLALSDGVSESIASTKKDMARLEQVLQAGGVSVEQLRAAAAEIVSVTRQPVPARQPGRESGEAKSVENEATDSRPNQGSLPQLDAKPTSPERTGTQDVFVGRLADAEVPVTGPMQAPQQRPAAPDFGTGPTRSLVQVGTNRPDVPAERAPQATEGRSASATVAVSTYSAPSSPAWSMQAVSQTDDSADQQSASFTSGSSPQPDYGDDFWRTQPQNTFSLSFDDSAVAERLPVPAAKPGAPGRQQSPIVAPGDSSEPAAPVSQAYGSASCPEGGDDDGADQRQAPAAPMMSTSSPSPTEGDVFLDGALLGRWMSKHLTAQVGRASAGPTGFDPRRGRLLPGATVGN